MKDIIVVIPAYNNEAGLRKTLNSIREKNLIDVIVIDDGSEIPISLDILNRIDSKINLHIINLKVNAGIVEALNVGLKYAIDNDYHYIARLDAGDICHENRFSKQKQYMIDNDIDVLGSWVNIIDEITSDSYTLKLPVINAEIKKKLRLFNNFIHPSVFMKKSYVVKNGLYTERYPALEDWEYFIRSIKWAKMGNYPEVLLDYYVSESSISTKNRFSQSLSKVKLLFNYFDMSLYSFLGIFRSIVLLCFTRNFLNNIKKTIYK